MQETLERMMLFTLVSHINAHANGSTSRPTLKDVQCFRNWRVHKFYSLKAMKTLKASSQMSNCKAARLDEEKDAQGNKLNNEYAK